MHGETMDFQSLGAFDKLVVSASLPPSGHFGGMAGFEQAAYIQDKADVLPGAVPSPGPRAEQGCAEFQVDRSAGGETLVDNCD